MFARDQEDMPKTLAREVPRGDPDEFGPLRALETYSGAKSRMTLPNRCCVSACERRPSGSNNSPAAGEINSAKQAGVSRDLANASRTSAVVADKERFSKASNGSALNSATKLMELPYQKRWRRQGANRGSFDK